MIVDQFNTTLTAGAATAAMRLHDSLLAAGIDSRIWCCEPPEKFPATLGYHTLNWSPTRQPPLQQFFSLVARQLRRLMRKWELKRGLKKRQPGSELFTSPRTPQVTRYSQSMFGGDVLHLHWVTKMIDYESFFPSLPRDLPVVWTLHDMNPFTGGCHYSGGCTAYVDECKHCPQLGRRGDRDLSNRSFHVKNAALRDINLHVVTPSHWLEGEARRSRILSHAKSFQTIHNGLDVDVFTSLNKSEARRKLKLPDDRVVIAFGAESLSHRRKGFCYLLEALKRLDNKQAVLGLTFGNGVVPKEQGLPEIRSMGFISEPARQATVYSAADIFVMPSLEDNLPQTGVESMACGTPVVAFDTGGIPDYVRPPATGLLAEVGNAADLAVKISQLMENTEQRLRMGVDARELIEREFHHEKQAKKYIDLYQALLDARSDAAHHEAA